MKSKIIIHKKLFFLLLFFSAFAYGEESNNYIEKTAKVNVIKYVEKVFGKDIPTMKDYFFYEKQNEAENVLERDFCLKEQIKEADCSKMFSNKYYNESSNLYESLYYTFLRSMMKEDSSKEIKKAKIIKTTFNKQCHDCLTAVIFEIKYRNNIFVVWYSGNQKSEELGLAGVLSINGITIKEKLYKTDKGVPAH